MTDTDRTDVRYLVIGRCVGAYGLDGELRIQILSDFPERFLKLQSVAIGEQLRPYQVVSARESGDFAYLRVVGVTTAAAASKLRDELLYIPIAEAETPPEGSLFWYELIGMRTITEAGELLGTVTDILLTGANDVYVVSTPAGGELLIPAVDEFVTAIDKRTATITVRLAPGME